MGGEPFYKNNVGEILNLIMEVHERCPETKIYIWSGYTYDDLSTSTDYTTISIL